MPASVQSARHSSRRCWYGTVSDAEAAEKCRGGSYFSGAAISRPARSTFGQGARPSRFPQGGEAKAEPGRTSLAQRFTGIIRGIEDHENDLVDASTDAAGDARSACW